MINNTINGRTPEEIKKGLECCLPFDEERCCDCSYCHGEEACYTQKNNDVLALIQRLKDERDELLQENQQLERERDAAVEALHGHCCQCIHFVRGKLLLEKEICMNCEHNFGDESLGDNWQWRGVEVE